jgi:2-hydroxychromene-2-carboxylate isomerase
MAHIDYYFTPVSPWAYLGSLRFIDIVKRHGASVRVMPVDLGKVFETSGGLPLARRPPQRQAYRLMELKRWRDFLHMPLVLQPRSFPVDASLASRLIIAAREAGQDTLFFSHLLGRAIWAEERNIAEPDTLEEIVTEAGLDPAPLFRAADSEAVKASMQADTDRAIAANVFGAPTYAIDGELFWGQDRLDFVERALAARV